MVEKARLCTALVVFLTATLGYSAAAVAQVSKEDTGISHRVLRLHDSYQPSDPFATLPLFDGQIQPSNLLRIKDGRVLVDAVAAHDANELMSDLVLMGMTGGTAHGRMVSGWFPIEAIPELRGLTSLIAFRPNYADTNVGLVTSQGDDAMRSDVARPEFEVDGRGIRVGVISDTFDDSATAATTAREDIATDDLPADIIVLDDTAGPRIDEGRGMMQIIHDVAPGASLAFHTGFNGEADFAEGILELARVAGADIIVDDVTIATEPMFQDGIVAQAIDAVKEAGVAYFSSAGNRDRQAYESPYVAGEFFDPFTFPRLVLNPSAPPPPFFGGIAHDFDPGPNVDVFQRIVLLPGAELTVTFQWDEPFASASLESPGSASDYDIYLFVPAELVQGDLPAVLAGSVDLNVGRDPVEVTGFVWPGSFPLPVDVMLVRSAGPPARLLKYVRFRSVDVVVEEFDTRSPASFGHNHATGAQSVAAAFYQNTPVFGVNPPEAQGFSSSGSTPILFEVDGTRKAEPDVRFKPEITAPDGVNTTFFPPPPQPPNDVEEDGFPNFFGTSAAAPHAAAVAALLLDSGDDGEDDDRLTPDQIYDRLERTAIDMDDPDTTGFDTGFDFKTGFGFVDALAALGDDDDEDDDDGEDDDEDEDDRDQDED